jgi:hypothetical protein
MNKHPKNTYSSRVHSDSESVLVDTMPSRKNPTALQLVTLTISAQNGSTAWLTPEQARRVADDLLCAALVAEMAYREAQEREV